VGGDRPAEPIADDRRPAGLRKSAAKAGEGADAHRNRGAILAAVAPARQQQQQERGDKEGNDPARGHGIESAEEIGADRHADQGTEHHDRGGAAIGMFPGVWNERRGRHEIDHEQQRRHQPRRGDAACERHEDQRGAESGKSARSSRDEGDCADRKGGIEVEAGWDEAKRAHPRRTPPVFFVTSATILAATASIS
jgi:hypothetical protein